MREKKPAVFSAGAGVGLLGGLIGLGGAEFRLPLLIGVFRFQALEAVILNKAISLVVVLAALPVRSFFVPFGAVLVWWPAILNLLAGSLIGAWIGAGWATRLQSQHLYRVIAVLLLLIALVLLLGHNPHSTGRPLLQASWLIPVGLLVGLGIGIVASLLGVAGGELLIPTFVLLFGADIKMAGSLSLAVSLPTMLIGFARYSRDRSFAVLGQHQPFVLWMALGLLVGTATGGVLLGWVSATVLLPLLATILVLSAIKLWRHV
ncbi:sulfite exporter TauE/SafE family protein [Pseudomonas aeruginosa]|uniref:sulfite exporter TauE/SafE family protein n=1 Tax=Pseudomonas aeruginosa TaxID=287 RepID=UPI002359283A